MALLPPASSQFYEPLPPCSSSAAIAGRLLPSLEPQCVARSPSPLELPGLGARTEVTEREHDKAVPRARRQTSTRNRSSTLSGPNLVLGTPFMGTFGSSSQPCEASEYPTKQERRSSGDAVSNTRKSGSFDPAGPTSDDEEERRGRRLLRPSATSSTCNPSRSRTPSKRTSRKPPKRWLSPDGKGTPWCAFCFRELFFEIHSTHKSLPNFAVTVQRLWPALRRRSPRPDRRRRISPRHGISRFSRSLLRIPTRFPHTCSKVLPLAQNLTLSTPFRNTAVANQSSPSISLVSSSLELRPPAIRSKARHRRRPAQSVFNDGTLSRFRLKMQNEAGLRLRWTRVQWSARKIGLTRARPARSPLRCSRATSR